MTTLQAGHVPQVHRDASAAARDTSHVDAVATRDSPRTCDWCDGPIPTGARADAETCGVVCRKRRWRFRNAAAASTRDVSRLASAAAPRDGSLRRPVAIDTGRMRFAYADPPYPGKAGYYVERQEVDHRELIADLEAGEYDGWALSTSSEALRDVLPLCPPEVRVCAWRRRVRPTRSMRPLSAWEPLLVVGGRPLLTDQPQEILDALDYRGRYDSFPGALVGMKPPEFAVWLFAQLGARTGDELVDVFPGSGAITRAWTIYTSRQDLDVVRDASACA